MRSLARLLLALALALPLTYTPRIAAAAPPAAPVLKARDQALYIVKAGLKSADFQARGMAYRGIAFDKTDKDLKKIWN